MQIWIPIHHAATIDRKSIGIPVPNLLLKVVDPSTGAALGPRKVGELYTKCDEGSPGYINNPAATKATFTDDGFYKTGDAVYYNEQGVFYIVDRYKEVIKVDTQQVAPAELESLLINHDQVSEVAVVGIPSEEHGQIPRAFVVPKNTSSKNQTSNELERELVDLVNKQVVFWKQLKGGVEFVDSLPKISIGKIDRMALRKLIGHKNL